VNLTKAAPYQITIPSPKTNANWRTEVSSEPTWAKDLTFSVVPGILRIQFSAFHPPTNQVARCKLTVRTVDSKPPVVKNCPNSFTIFLEPGEDKKAGKWEEPEFFDNVGVTSVLASQLPGQQLGVGRHVVIYQALDAAGNKERCVFSIRVAKLDPGLASPPSRSNRVKDDSQKPTRIWVLCRVGNTGRQIKLLVSRVPPGCRRIKIRP